MAEGRFININRQASTPVLQRQNWQRLRLLLDLVLTAIGGDIKPVKVTLLSWLGWNTGGNKKLQTKSRDVTVWASSAESAAADVLTAQEVTYVTSWRYDATTHRFQVKTRKCYVLAAETESDWTDATGTPTTSTNATAWRYDTTSHKFQVKTQASTVLEAAAASDWTDADGTQPTSLANVVRNVGYNTTSHVLDQDKTATVYVLEKGSDSDDQTIDTAETCAGT